MKKFFSFLFLAVLIFTFSACSKDIVATASKNITAYDISLRYNDESKTILAKQTTNYINSSEGSLEDVRFHLYPVAFSQGVKNKAISNSQQEKAYPGGISYGGIEITKVQVNGTVVAPSYSGVDEDILVVVLLKKCEPTKSVSIYIEYTITLPHCHHRFGVGENTVNLGNFYPVVCVRENGAFDESPYSSTGDPFFSQIANYKVSLSLPEKFMVASTGEQRTTLSAGTKTVNMTAKAVRDFAIVFSEKFEMIEKKVGKTMVKYYYFDDAEAQKNLQASVDSLKTFNDLFMLYPYKTLSVVKADFCHGGMEYPQLVYIASDIEQSNQYINVIIHEIAHQWWYGLVGNNEYKESWIDEPLAEFSTALFYKKNPNYNVRYGDVIKNAQENMSMFLAVYRDVLGEVNTSMNRQLNKYDTETEYVYMIYVKGTIMWDTLLNSIGERKVIKALSTFAQNYAFKIATREDLIATFEKSSRVKLNNFFTSWIEGKVVMN